MSPVFIDRDGGSRPLSSRSLIRLGLSLALCLALAAARTYGATAARPAWFATLRKPSWLPPDPVFPIVWVTVYIVLGVILWRLWDRVPPSSARDQSLAFFWAQLVLNAIWVVLFFWLRQPWVAVVDIVLMAPLSVLAMRAAFSVDRIAGWLLALYLVWVGFAVTLNVAIAILNT